MALKVYLKAIKFGTKGQLYDVFLNKPDGSLLVQSTREPIYSSCRKLKSLDFTGPVEFWREGASFPCFYVKDLVLSATLTVGENSRTGPRITNWKPFGERA